MLSTLGKSSQVLELFSVAHPERGVSEVADVLGIPKTSAHSLLATLAAVGLLRRTEGSRYRLGWKLLRLRQSLLESTRLRQEARPAMEQLATMADRRDGSNAFAKRYLVAPLEVRDPSGHRVVATVADDEGVTPTTHEGLARLRPVREGGTVSYGSQTHPADGNSGMVITTRDRARELSRDPSIGVQVLSYGQARCKPGFMPLAPVPAATAALEAAGLRIDDMAAIKTHNPFAVNDVYFSREFDLAPDAFNNHGSSLVFGHPQGPTGMRLVIELIEELVDRGGGCGLFSGCAAGDTAAALVVMVDSDA